MYHLVVLEIEMRCNDYWRKIPIAFWSDKRRSILIKKKQIEQGKLQGSLTALEQKILDLCDDKPTMTTKKKRVVKEEPCNGDDTGSFDEDFSNDYSQVDNNRLHSLEADERQLNMMDKLVVIMDQQSAALSQMAQATLTSSKALERIAEASHVQSSGYTSIEVLDLSYNFIFWIGLHAFSGLDKLVHVNLSNNRLRFIPSDLFWDTPELKILDMSSNIFESLKNEPFLMHAKLEVLNLNYCRIKDLPLRLFSRLPNLKKLDLSENYVVTIKTEVLLPLRKLERIELRNDYWQCNSNFIAVEDWISSRGITYQKQCNKRGLSMSEKMISEVPVERNPVEIGDVWNITMENNETVVEKPIKPITPFEKFDKDFSALQAFLIGMEIGLAIGIIGTYIWLNKFCKCGALRCTRPQRRQRRRRGQRLDGDMRTNLLWSTVVNPDQETPPPYRRELSLPDGSHPFRAYGLPTGVTEAPLQIDAIRLPDRAETPPPPYHDCRINI